MDLERRNLPAELAAIAEERADDGKPPRSPRTLARWKQKGPPPSIVRLLSTEAGRAQMARWVEEFAQQDQPQAA